jgi:type II secretion system protein G
MFKNYKKGFTLIELLVVIAIIGILSSVVLASLNTAREKSRDARRVTDINQLKLALELYYDDNAGYPVVATAANISTALADLATDGFIPVLPTDPNNTTNPYFYIGSATDYCLGAALEGTSNALDTCTLVLDAAYTFQVAP